MLHPYDQRKQKIKNFILNDKKKWEISHEFNYSDSLRHSKFRIQILCFVWSCIEMGTGRKAKHAKSLVIWISTQMHNTYHTLMQPFPLQTQTFDHFAKRFRIIKSTLKEELIGMQWLCIWSNHEKHWQFHAYTNYEEWIQTLSIWNGYEMELWMNYLVVPLYCRCISTNTNK